MCSMSAPLAPRSGRRLAGGSGGGSSWSSRASLSAGLASALGRGPLCSLRTWLPGVPPEPFCRAQDAGHRDSGGAPGARVCASHLGPLGSRLGAGGLGRSQSATAWTRAAGMRGRRGSQPPLWAAVSGEEKQFDLGIPGRPGWEPATPISTCVGGGVVWVGPTSAAAACPSSLSWGCLLDCPPSLLSSPRQQFQSISEGSPPRAGEGAGGCWNKDAQGLFVGLLVQRS